MREKGWKTLWWPEVFQVTLLAKECRWPLWRAVAGSSRKLGKADGLRGAWAGRMCGTPGPLHVPMCTHGSCGCPWASGDSRASCLLCSPDSLKIVTTSASSSRSSASRLRQSFLTSRSEVRTAAHITDKEREDLAWIFPANSLLRPPPPPSSHLCVLVKYIKYVMLCAHL